MRMLGRCLKSSPFTAGLILASLAFAGCVCGSVFLEGVASVDCMMGAGVVSFAGLIIFIERI